jgi:hypothetical protein
MLKLFSAYLGDIKTWLDANDNQVVTLLLTNGDFVDVSLFGTAMSSSGLDTYAFTPTSQLAIDEWPTLQELIDAGTRLVMFLGRHPPPSGLNCQLITSQITTPTPAWFLT